MSTVKSLDQVSIWGTYDHLWKFNLFNTFKTKHLLLSRSIALPGILQLVSLSANGTASWRARSIRPDRLPNQARRSSKSGSARNPRTGKCVTPTVTVRMATAWHVGGPFLTKPKTSASWASLSISELCVLVFDLIIQKLIYMRCMVHSCSIVCQRTSCSIVYQRTSCSTSVCPWHQAQVSS